VTLQDYAQKPITGDSILRTTRLKTLALLIAISLATAACAVRVGYEFLDVAMMWSLDDYIDFDSQQRDDAKDVVKEFHQWHRINALPDYAVQLDALASDLEKPVSIDTMRYYSELIFTAWQEVMQALALPSAKILADVTPAQIREMQLIMEAKDQDDRNDLKSEPLSKLYHERYEFMDKAASRLTGKLNDQQRILIRRWATSLQDTRQMSVDNRSAWRERFIAIISEHASVDVMAQQLSQLYTQPYQFWSNSYEQSMDYNRERTLKLVTELANSMTDKQRAHAIKRLRGVAEDFRALSRE
jgi:hypothetical protein